MTSAIALCYDNNINNSLHVRGLVIEISMPDAKCYLAATNFDVKRWLKETVAYTAGLTKWSEYEYDDGIPQSEAKFIANLTNLETRLSRHLLRARRELESTMSWNDRQWEFEWSRKQREAAEEYDETFRAYEEGRAKVLEVLGKVDLMLAKARNNAVPGPVIHGLEVAKKELEECMEDDYPIGGPVKRSIVSMTLDEYRRVTLEHLHKMVTDYEEWTENEKKQMTESLENYTAFVKFVNESEGVE